MLFHVGTLACGQLTIKERLVEINRQLMWLVFFIPGRCSSDLAFAHIPKPEGPFPFDDAILSVSRPGENSPEWQRLGELLFYGI